ncbi:MAG: hypothetical protein PVG49_18530 [Desulfobacteraceae bacterium]|jgi:hypothetical protein
MESLRRFPQDLGANGTTGPMGEGRFGTHAVWSRVIQDSAVKAMIPGIRRSERP